MGLFSGIASFVSNAVEKIGSVFKRSPLPSPQFPPVPFKIENSTSHSTTTYDPDRVKAAEIEYAGKIKLAGMEKERLEYAKQAQLDIIEAQTQSRIAQEQARAEGFERIAEAITDMQERLNVIAERRITIIERGTLQAVREAESFYAELTAKIQQDNDKYTAEKLPALLDMLGRYEQGTSAHTLFMKKIEDDISIQAKHTTRQLESVLTRQERMIDEIMTAKGRISEQTSQITAAMLEAVKEKIEELDTSKPILPALPE
ncbi:MAG: hypothetical protein II869_05020 [Synergistaceae bacterium]|nr:hypothetical protein [Synergistaceae bacterium]